MQIQKKCRVARPKLAGVVQPGDAAHAQLSSRKVTGGTATPTPVRPPPQEPHLELSEPVCSWDIKSGLGRIQGNRGSVVRVGSGLLSAPQDVGL